MASKHPRRRSCLFPKSDEKRKQHRRYARASGPSLRLESLERRIVFAAGLSLDVSVEGKDASIQPGPSVAPGTAIEWIYQVTNPGNVSFAGLNILTASDEMVSHPTRPYVDVSASDRNRVLVINTLTLEIESFPRIALSD